MTEFPENPFPIGSRVRWDGKYSRGGADPWVGVVTAHTSHKSVQCDGKGSIANGLLELVEGPAPEVPAAPPVDPMAELIAQQCELIAELQDKADRADELENHLGEAVARLEAYLSEECGMPRPVRIDSPELRALAELLFEGV